MRVGLIGLGNLGTAIGNLVAENGIDVLGWEYHQETVHEINELHLNSRFLPGISLAENLRATNDITQVFESCEVIFIAIPSAFIERTLEPFRGKIDRNILFVNMAKGIDRRSGLTSFQVVESLFSDHPCIMLSGPSIANEFARHLPTIVMLAGENRHDLLLVARLLDNNYFRTRFSTDTIGVELGGILKNIYAIGLGLFDGKNITSINFRAVYLTVALEEIARIGVGMGAHVETFLYLAGIGDLLATSLSAHSHNRHMGELLAGGLSRQQIIEEMGVLPEGYNTLEAVLYLAEKLHISIPLAHGLWDVIHGRSSADEFIYSFIKDFVAI